jgi:hypothetical protein
MKVACLTCFVPRRENISGPSGLLYQTLKWRPAHISITVFLFVQDQAGYLDFPEVVELAASGIQFVSCSEPSKQSPAPRYWPLGARQIARVGMPDLSDFDAVWAYPYWFAPFLRNCQRPVLISGMDCATLLYWRKLKNTSIMSFTKLLRTAAGLMANALFEIQYLRGRQVHVVGQADAQVLQLAMVSAMYIPHPFLAYPPINRPARQPRHTLTFLLSNPGDPIYGSPKYLSWVQDLFKHLHDAPAVRLIVHKSTPESLRAINAAAQYYPRVTVESVTWVDDYSVLLSTIDVQLFPLDIGAGTKTSVLTALQHGVHAICSPVAAENVQPNPLLFVANDRLSHFDDALSCALASVSKGDVPPRLVETLTQHSPKDCGARFWNYIKTHVK